MLLTTAIEAVVGNAHPTKKLFFVGAQVVPPARK